MVIVLACVLILAAVLRTLARSVFGCHDQMLCQCGSVGLVLVVAWWKLSSLIQDKRLWARPTTCAHMVLIAKDADGMEVSESSLASLMRCSHLARW